MESGKGVVEMYQLNIKAKLIDDTDREDFQKKMDDFLNTGIRVEDIQFMTNQAGDLTRFSALVLYYDNTRGAYV